MKLSNKTILSALLGASVFMAAPSVVQANGNNSNGRTVIYFTRHAEKLTVVDPLKDMPGTYVDNCDEDRERCEEALNALGEERARLLALWFERRGIAHRVTHVISSDKQRTRQTVEPLAQLIAEYGGDWSLPDSDGVADGVQQIPFAGDKANEITSNSKSVEPTIAALEMLPPGSVAVVAGHSGTLYRIFGGADTDGLDSDGAGDEDYAGLGIDTTNDPDVFPKKSNGKVKDFGDVWKVVIRKNGTAVVKWRKNLEFKRLTVKNEIGGDLDD